MEKRSVLTGIIFVIIFLIISILLLTIPCNPYYVGGGFFGAVCKGDIWFTLLNLPGAIIIKLITGMNPPDSLNIKLFSVLVNIPIYFIIGFILGRIFKKGDKKQ